MGTSASRGTGRSAFQHWRAGLTVAVGPVAFTALLFVVFNLGVRLRARRSARANAWQLWPELVALDTQEKMRACASGRRTIEYAVMREIRDSTRALDVVRALILGEGREIRHVLICLDDVTERSGWKQHSATTRRWKRSGAPPPAWRPTSTPFCKPSLLASTS